MYNARKEGGDIMKYYQKLSTIPAFTFYDASRIIGNPVLVTKNLNSMIKEGSAHRIKRNLYTCINFSTGDDFASRYDIASKITDDSFLSFHSAFEFYGFYNQSYFEVQVCSTKRFTEFSYNEYNYKCFLTNNLIQVDVIQGVRVATIERTIIDSINMLGKAMDAEELVKCLELIHKVNEKKLLEMLTIYDKEVLYRKTGYVLSHFKDDLHLSDGFFQICKSKGVLSNKGYLVPTDKVTLVFNSEWGIYAYGNLRKLTFKGGEADV